MPAFVCGAVISCMTMSSSFAATFYWDNNNTTAGFGVAGAGGATWAQNSTTPATGSNSARWKTDSTGVASGSATQSTNANDVFNFGTSTNGLGTGTITVSGSVTMGNTNYGSASGVITLTGGTINFGAAKVITVNNTTNTINSVVGGAATSLTKAGAGTLVFGGDNTYTGSTIINAGTLALSASGSIDDSAGVLLGGGTFDVSAKGLGGYTLGNLSGSGTVVGALTVSTQLAIGASPGTIDFESLTLASASTYLFDLTGGGTAADLANVSGTLALEGGVLDLVQLGTYTQGDKFTLFAYDSGNLTGAFDGLADGDIFTGAGGQWQIDYDDNSAGLNGGTGTSFVTITAVPEPSAALLGALGALGFLRRRRL